MTKKTSETHGWFSKNAQEAIKHGEMPYDMWTVERMLNDLSELAAKEENYVQDYYDPDMYANIDTNVLKEALLRKSSWHHVNGNCVWFYSLKGKAITQEMYNRLRKESISKRAKDAHPRLVYVAQTKWESNPQGHQRARQEKHIAVVYQGKAYFSNGGSQFLRDGKCQETGSAGKIVKNNRKIFEKIVHQMRTHYAVMI